METANSWGARSFVRAMPSCSTGSILLGGTQEIVTRVSRLPAPLGNESSLGEALGRTVAIEEVTDAIMEESGAAPIETEWLDRAASPHVEHFRSPEWTWRR